MAIASQVSGEESSIKRAQRRPNGAGREYVPRIAHNLCCVSFAQPSDFTSCQVSNGSRQPQDVHVGIGDSFPDCRTQLNQLLEIFSRTRIIRQPPEGYSGSVGALFRWHWLRSLTYSGQYDHFLENAEIAAPERIIRRR